MQMYGDLTPVIGVKRFSFFKGEGIFQVRCR